MADVDNNTESKAAAESDAARALVETGNSTSAQSSVSDHGPTGDQTLASAHGPTGDQTTRIARRVALVAAVSAAVAAVVFFIGTPMPMGNYESGVGGVPVRLYLIPELSACVLGIGLLSALVFFVAFPTYLAGSSRRGRVASGIAGAFFGSVVVFVVGFACLWNFPLTDSASGEISRIELNYGFTQAHTIGFERRYLLFMTPTEVVFSDYLGR